jgi:hypothetical protein
MTPVLVIIPLIKFPMTFYLFLILVCNPAILQLLNPFVKDQVKHGSVSKIKVEQVSDLPHLDP